MEATQLGAPSRMFGPGRAASRVQSAAGSTVPAAQPQLPPPAPAVQPVQRPASAAEQEACSARRTGACAGDGARSACCEWRPQRAEQSASNACVHARARMRTRERAHDQLAGCGEGPAQQPQHGQQAVVVDLARGAWWGGSLWGWLGAKHAIAENEMRVGVGDALGLGGNCPAGCHQPPGRREVAPAARQQGGRAGRVRGGEGCAPALQASACHEHQGGSAAAPECGTGERGWRGARGGARGWGWRGLGGVSGRGGGGLAADFCPLATGGTRAARGRRQPPAAAACRQRGQKRRTMVGKW